jgi:hypothetical protein
MNRFTRSRDWLTLVPVFLLASPAVACTLCAGNLQNRATLRQEAKRSRIVLVGKMGAATETADGGTTVFHIEQIVRGVELIANSKQVVLPRYLPENPQQRKTWLLFGDLRDGRFVYDSARVVSDMAVAVYVQDALALDDKPRSAAMKFFADRLGHAVPEIAGDAFVELSRATDAEVGELARQLDPKKLRELIISTKTPAEQVGLLAFLLSGCGSERDAELLRSLLDGDSEPSRIAFGGLLAGYIVLKPDAGWKLALSVVRDDKRQFLTRYATIGALRFLQGWRGAKDRSRIVSIYGEAILHSDLADMVVEDLRRWQWWDLTPQVLAAFGKKSNDGPMFRRAVVRYALTCPQPPAQRFIVEQRKLDPEFVSEMEESLRDAGE